MRKILFLSLTAFFVMFPYQGFSQALGREAYHARINSFRDSLQMTPPEFSPTRYCKIEPRLIVTVTPFNKASKNFSTYLIDRTFSEGSNLNYYATSSADYELVPDGIELQVLIGLYNSTNGTNWTDNNSPNRSARGG